MAILVDYFIWYCFPLFRTLNEKQNRRFSSQSWSRPDSICVVVFEWQQWHVHHQRGRPKPGFEIVGLQCKLCIVWIDQSQNMNTDFVPYPKLDAHGRLRDGSGKKVAALCAEWCRRRSACQSGRDDHPMPRSLGQRCPPSQAPTTENMLNIEPQSVSRGSVVCVW